MAIFKDRDTQRYNNQKSIWKIIYIVLVIIFSIVIYLNRNTIQSLGNYSYVGIFLLTFLANASVLLPSPSILFVILGASFLNPFLVALIGSAGSTLGELTGYFAGKVGNSMIAQKQASTLKKYFEKNEALAIFIFALIPLPFFDFVGLLSGYYKTPIWKFIIFCFIGKTIKMFLYVSMFQYII